MGRILKQMRIVKRVYTHQEHLMEVATSWRADYIRGQGLPFTRNYLEHMTEAVSAVDIEIAAGVP